MAQTREFKSSLEELKKALRGEGGQAAPRSLRLASLNCSKTLMLVSEVSVKASSEGHCQRGQPFIPSLTQDCPQCLVTTEC